MFPLLPMQASRFWKEEGGTHPKTEFNYVQSFHLPIPYNSNLAHPKVGKFLRKSDIQLSFCPGQQSPI